MALAYFNVCLVLFYIILVHPDALWKFSDAPLWALASRLRISDYTNKRN